MSKKIAKKDTTKEIQVFTKTTSMGVADEVTANDVQMPTVMLMQSNATFVKDRSNDIKSGDFVHSITKEVWGSIDSPIRLCVVDMFKTRVVTDVNNNNEWVGTETWTPEMESEPYESEIDGKLIRKAKIFNYICFRPLDVREIDLPDGSKHYIASPVVVKFKGGSSKNAKKFNQLLKDYASFKQPSWCRSFDLVGYEDTNKDGQTYFVFDFKPSEPTHMETQLAAAAMSEMTKMARSAGTMEVIDTEEVTVEKTVVPNMAPGANQTSDDNIKPMV